MEQQCKLNNNQLSINQDKSDCNNKSTLNCNELINTQSSSNINKDKIKSDDQQSFTSSNSSKEKQQQNKQKQQNKQQQQEPKRKRDTVDTTLVDKLDYELGMKAGVKILGTGGGYTDPSLVIMSNEKKYVFNLGNGINRQNTKHRIYDAYQLFLTHHDPSSLTDFPNYLLRTKNDISIVGPSNTTHAILAHRYYIGRGKKSIHITECTEDKDICLGDLNITVYPIVIKPTISNNNNNNNRSTNLKERKKYPFIHSFKKELCPNHQFKLAAGENSMTRAKTFYDWTLLRGGIVHTYSGSSIVSTYDIDQYLVYQLMKLEKDIERKDRLMYRPTNYKDVKQYLYGEMEQETGARRGEIRISQQHDEFMSIESRYFRLVRRVDNLEPLTMQQRQQMMKMRAKKYTEDKVYGPAQSHIHTIESHHRDPANGMSDVLAYLVHLPDIVGKFDAKQADKMGVPNGPLRAQLCRGQPVTTTTGVVVRPEDVVSPSTIGAAVLVISIPHIAYLPSLLSNTTIRDNCHESGTHTGQRSGMVAHMVSEEIFNSPEYRVFVNSFSSRWRHILFNQSCAFHELTVKSAQMVNGLNGISPTFFPSLAPFTPAAPIQSQGLKFADKVERARFQQVVVLNPLPTDKCPVVESKYCTEDVDTSFKYETRDDQEQQVDKKESIQSEFIQKTEAMIQGLSRQELEVVFLGTGCSQSSDYRDESCIYLDLFDKGGVIFDVGGGSYSQMYRRYGGEVTMRKLALLKLVYISHMHTDHHQGLQKILEMRHNALELLGVPENKRRIAILSQSGGKFYISEVMRSLTLGPNLWSYIRFYRTANIHEPIDPRADELSSFLKQELSLVSWLTIPVHHSFGATAIELKSASGWSVAYSGDTSFCQALCDGLKDITILIHEATFNDEQHAFAKAKSHCTMGQAIQTSEAINCYRTVLTHFSQRYPSIDTILHNQSTSTALAFDLMSINIKDLHVLPSALSKLKIERSQEDDVEIDLDQIQ